MAPVHYGGVLLHPADVAPTVASVCGGRIPSPKRGRPHTDDPVAWLDGLLRETQGSSHYDVVVRALDMSLRTGSSSQLATVAAVGRRHPILDVGAALATLDRPAAWQRTATAIDLCAAINAAVLEGRAPFDDRMRMLAADRRLDGALWPALLLADRDWLLDDLGTLLGREPARRVPQLVAALDALGPEARAAALEGIAARLTALPEPTRDALLAALTELAPPAPAAPAPPPPRLDVGELPWRGDDGAWFEIPAGLRFPQGSYSVRRGWHRWRVDPRAIEPYRISEQRAAILRGAQVEALWRTVAATSGGLLPDSAAEVFGAPAATVATEAEAQAKAAVRVHELSDQLTAVLGSPEARALADKLKKTLLRGRR